MYDNEAAARYLYGGVDRMRTNIATSQAAYAEGSKRTGRSLAPAGMSLAQAVRPNNPDYEGLSIIERTGSNNPSISAAAAKIGELLAAHPMATDKARFKMFREWLADNPELQRAINAYFLTATHQLSFAPPALPSVDIMLKREIGL